MKQFVFLSEYYRFILCTFIKLVHITIKQVFNHFQANESEVPPIPIAEWIIRTHTMCKHEGLKWFNVHCTYFSCQVFKNSGTVDCSCGSNTSMACGPVFQMPVNTSYGKLQNKCLFIYSACCRHCISGFEDWNI
jgi:hypothetical protein